MLNSIQMAVLRTLLPKVSLAVLFLMTSRILLASPSVSVPEIPNNPGELGGFSSAPNLPLNVSDDKPTYTSFVDIAVFLALSGQDRTCEEFNEYIQKHGITDSKGKPRPTEAGLTAWDIYWKPVWTPTTSVEEFGSNFEACINSGPIKPNFYAPTQITMLTWVPKKTPSTACKKEYADWRVALRRHENKHVKVAKDGAKEMNKNWNPSKHQLKVCKTRPSALTAERDANTELRKSVNSYLRKAIQEDKKTISKQQDDVDKEKLRPLNCNICK